MSKIGIEDIRKYFFDPTCPENNIEHLETVDKVFTTMGEIYGSSGQISQMSAETRAWLLESAGKSGEPTVDSVSAQLMIKEMGTRLFDEFFMGQIHPQGSAIGIIGQAVGAYMNTNTIVEEVSRAENRMEQQVLDRFATWFGFDLSEYAGNVVTGGTLGNMQAMWVARQKARARVSGSERRHANYYVIASKRAHYSVDKACQMLGMSVVRVPTTDFKTDIEGTRAMIAELQKHPRRSDGTPNVLVAVVGLAGETETGLVDDLAGLAELAHEHQLHFHVDAAYGGPFIHSQAKELFEGIEKADSITVDGHKALWTPYFGGATLYRDGRDLTLVDRTMRNGARYLVGQENNGDKPRDFGMSRVEGSMGAGPVIAMWATMELFGEEGLEVLLNYTIEMTQHLFQRVERSHILQALHIPETNTLQVGTKIPTPDTGVKSYNNLIKATIKRLDKLGFYVSPNDDLDDGRTSFRFVIMNPFTTPEIIDEMVTLLEDELSESFGLDTIAND